MTTRTRKQPKTGKPWEADWLRRLPAIRKRLELIAKTLDIPMSEVDEVMKYKCTRAAPLIRFCERHGQSMDFIIRGAFPR